MLRNWLKKAIEAPPTSPELPDPRSAKSPHESDIIAACNHEISKSTPSPSVERKRGIYDTYDSTQRAKMAHYAVDHKVAVAARHFTKSLRKNVNESTIRNLKKEFLRIRKDIGSDPSTRGKSGAQSTLTVREKRGRCQNLRFICPKLRGYYKYSARNRVCEGYHKK